MGHWLAKLNINHGCLEITVSYFAGIDYQVVICRIMSPVETISVMFLIAQLIFPFPSLELDIIKANTLACILPPSKQCIKPVKKIIKVRGRLLRLQEFSLT